MWMDLYYKDNRIDCIKKSTVTVWLVLIDSLQVELGWKNGTSEWSSLQEVASNASPVSVLSADIS